MEMTQQQEGENVKLPATPVPGSLSSPQLDAYHRLSASINKRFFRAPTGETAQAFSSLALDLKRERSFPYAALCCAAAARCYSVMGDQLQQMSSQHQSGSLLLQHTRLHAHASASGDQQDLQPLLQDAIFCMQAAAKVAETAGYASLCAQIHAELADHLWGLQMYEDSARAFLCASEACIKGGNDLCRKQWAGMAAQSLIRAGDWAAAQTMVEGLLSGRQSHLPPAMSSDGYGHRAPGEGLQWYTLVLACCLIRQRLWRALQAVWPLSQHGKTASASAILQTVALHLKNDEIAEAEEALEALVDICPAWLFDICSMAARV